MSRIALLAVFLSLLPLAAQTASDRPEIAALGCAGNAEFAVDMKPGFSLGGALDGPAVQAIKPGGTHGHSPVHPEMLAAFPISGPGRDLTVLNSAEAAKH